MSKSWLLAAVALASAVATMPAAPAAAQYRADDRAYERAYRDGYNRYYYPRRPRERCHTGDGGTIIGAIAGGLLGRSVDTRGDRTLGTVLGAGAGALAGHAVDRSNRPGYCR